MMRTPEIVRKTAQLYKPSKWREKGLLWSSVLLAATLAIIIAVTGFFWNEEPDLFDVVAASNARISAATDNRPVVGVVYTGTLLEIAETLLYKRGGYLSNDIMPPGVFMDNIPNWEFGALVILRDAASMLRNQFSRSQSQSTENEHLAKAEPQLHFSNDSWILPSTESEYKDAIKALAQYLAQVADPNQQQSQFFARANNLVKLLEVMEMRLGSLSQRLSASVGQVRINTDLAGDPSAQQSTVTPTTVIVQTGWFEIDDIFYESRGSTWALLHILQAVEYDFRAVLDKKAALTSIRQIIRELKAAQEPTLSPVVINGSGFGLFANYSLTMANYIARANAAIIDLRNLLEKG